MKVEINNGEIVQKTDLRELLLSTEVRENVVSQIAAHMTCKLVRLPHGLGLMIQDAHSETVLSVVDLQEVFRTSLQDGTLTRNALDGLPETAALNQVVLAFEALLAEAVEARDDVGLPEAELSGGALMVRQPGVEAEADQMLEHVG